MIGKSQLVALSDFRFRLTEFVRFSEAAAREAGLTPRQYLLLLHLCGYAGRDWATVRELADRLHASHQATAALVQRCVRNRLVKKQRSKQDERCVEVRPTPETRRRIERIAARHHDRILAIGAHFKLGAKSGARRKSS